MSFNLSKPNRTIQAGVVLMGGETEILDVAPIDLLAGMSKNTIKRIPIKEEFQRQGLDIEFHWVSEKGKITQLTAGCSVKTESFAECPPLDIVLMGAHNFDTYTANEAELAFVRKAYEQCSALLLICAGYVVADMAGLLKGKTCTAPRLLLDMQRQQSPDTNWVDGRWAHDGKIWTSGALLNGQDMMAAFVRHVWGGEGSFVEQVLDIGGWPQRGKDYAGEEGYPFA